MDISPSILKSSLLWSLSPAPALWMMFIFTRFPSEIAASCGKNHTLSNESQRVSVPLDVHVSRESSCRGEERDAERRANRSPRTVPPSLSLAVLLKWALLLVHWLLDSLIIHSFIYLRGGAGWAGPGLNLGPRNWIQVSCVGGRNPIIWGITTALQGCWGQGSVLELNTGTPIWDAISFIWKVERHSEWVIEWQRKREISHLLVHSSNAFNSQNWVRLKSGGRKSI